MILSENLTDATDFHRESLLLLQIGLQAFEAPTLKRLVELGWRGRCHFQRQGSVLAAIARRSGAPRILVSRTSRPLYSWKRIAFMKGILMVTIDSPPLTAASHSASLFKRDE
jgi:hypothetical protein